MDLAAAVALFALNFFLASRLFHISVFGGLYSIEGSFIGIAKERSEQGHLFPLWYAGIPWPNTYPQLLHAIVSFVSRKFTHDPGLAYHIVTGIFYCLGPVAMFVLVRLLTRRYYPALLAGLAMSTIAPSIAILPGIYPELLSYFRPRRLQVMIEWGEGPHISAITWMLMALGAMVFALRRKTPWAYALAAVFAAATLSTNWIGVAALGMAVLVYLTTHRATGRDWLTAVGIGAATYGLAMAWMPLSTVQTIRRNSDWVAGSFPIGWKQGLGMFVLAVSVILLDRLLGKVRVSAPTRFCVLLAGVFGIIASSQYWLAGFYFMPQPHRYQLEMELFLLAGLILLFSEIPKQRVRLGGLAILLLVSAQGISEGLAYGNQILHGSTIERTVEYKVAHWLYKNHPGERVYCPGTFSQWLDVFVPQPQLGGGFDQGSTNPLLPAILFQIMAGEGKQMAAYSKTWLEAFGTGFVVVGNEKSEEYFKPFKDKKKFDDVLPVVYRTEGEAIYQLDPSRAALAVHVSEQAVKGMKWVGSVYPQTVDAMLATIPSDRPVRTEWKRDVLVLNANPRAGEVVSVRFNALPGWSAQSNSRELTVSSDALGLITIQPAEAGPQSIVLSYKRPFEYRVGQAVTAFTVLFFGAWVAMDARRRYNRRVRLS